MLHFGMLLSLGPQIALAASKILSPNFLNPRATSVIVNLAQTYQTMDGFGFSQAFGRANDLYNLPSAQRTNALDLLFSTTTGAGMTILRNRIGSGGVGDSIEPTAPASPSATPTYVWDGNDTSQVWVSQQAKSYGVTTFYADAWSAPGFMKTNDNQDNGGYLCGVTGETCSSGSWLQAYANFLVQYIKDYASVGITITHVGFLNEPDLTTSYSSMQSSGTQAADFIKVLYPTLQSAGLSSVGINCCDAEGWNDQVTMTAQLISAGVQNMISRITSHSYTSDPTSPISTTRPVWETEYADLNDAFSTTWYSSGAASEGLYWASLIYTGIVNANLSAYLGWEGIEDGTTSSTLISISGTTVTPSARLWAFGQWSRYVRPGAVRLGTSGSVSGMQISAFKNTDGSVSVQMINIASSSQAVTVSTSGGGFTATAVQAYITNNSNNNINSMTASISGGAVSATVPGYSMVTFVLTGGTSSGGGTTSSISGSTITSAAYPSTSTSSKAPTSTTTASGATQTHYGQCGGTGYSGPTTCQSPYTCTYSNAYYSQCL